MFIVPEAEILLALVSKAIALYPQVMLKCHKVLNTDLNSRSSMLAAHGAP